MIHEDSSDSRRPLAKGAPAGVDPSVGDITYYAPWGNLALFYKDFGYAKGLIKLGSIDDGMEVFSVPGSIMVTIEALKKENTELVAIRQKFDARLLDQSGMKQSRQSRGWFADGIDGMQIKKPKDPGQPAFQSLAPHRGRISSYLPGTHTKVQFGFRTINRTSTGLILLSTVAIR